MGVLKNADKSADYKKHCDFLLRYLIVACPFMGVLKDADKSAGYQ
jgi:hypothetical protein